MLQFIDETNEVDGFAYTDKWGEIEKVMLSGDAVEIIDSDNGTAVIFKEDIPKMIKALQSAYNHKDD